MDKKLLTLFVLGLPVDIFPCVIFNRPFVALVSAFFDWLPLPTGWMKFKDKVNKRITKLHAVVTLVAYLFFVVSWSANYTV
ncbi:MAG: hypothetical protein B6U94_03960 [Thermofilum sp. ex4484_79]|nr:MAG: hypothetical protein B6U94_03960 [Thermofilum sp. ex4484_79]